MVFRLHYFLSFALATANVVLAGPPPGKAIQQFLLDEQRVYEIAVGQDVPTTLMFPSAVTAIEGANVSTHPETPAPILLAYTPGRSFFSVRALDANAKGAVNVVWKNRTFVLRFATGPEPCGSVTFYEDDRRASSAPSPQKRVTPQVLLSLLDKAKTYSVLAVLNPDAIRKVEKTEPGTFILYNGFSVVVEEVIRFDPEDTLVFRIRLSNTTEREVIYQPQRLAVRVGDQVYPASIADASGIIPPKATTLAYFAITGTPLGNRADLSLNNTFKVIVPRVERDAQLIFPQ